MQQNKRGPRQERQERQKEINGVKKNQNENHMSYRDLEFQYNNVLKRQNSPKVDLTELDDWYFIRVEMPGFYQEDIKVQLKENQIILVSATKHEDEFNDHDNNIKKIIYKECKYGNVMRRIKLHNKVIYKSIEKSYTNGILFIYVQQIDKTTFDSRLDETNQETTQETIQETTQETTRETIQETTQETTRETIQETIQEIIQETTNLWNDIDFKNKNWADDF